jgi:hypothetical protein
MKIYKSCSCSTCRIQSQGGTQRKFHRNEAHRKFRQFSKRMIKNGDYEVPIICTGYRD